MRTPYYHGSPTFISGTLTKGTCVSSVKGNALRFARRYCRGDCYIYLLWLDTAADLEQHIDSAGTVDWVLVRDTPFCERILVTDKLLAECQAASEADGLS